MGPGRRPSQPSQPVSHNASQQPQRRPSHQRTATAPEALPISRIPSTGDGRARRLTNPTSPNLTPSAVSSTNSASYFSPQPAASGAEARSPANRRPPASRSANGLDTSRGPPITRAYSSEVARRAQKPADFAFAHQQLMQLGLVSPGGSNSHKPSSIDSSGGSRGRRDIPGNASDSASRARSQSRQHSIHSDNRREEQMASSLDESSDYDSGRRSQLGDTLTLNKHRTGDGSRNGGSGTEADQNEDLFLNIAQDTPQKGDGEEGIHRVERRWSRIGRASNRQSLPTNAYPSSASQHDSMSPNANKTPSSLDTRQNTHRRASNLPSPSLNVRNLRDQSPISPATALDTHRSRVFGLSPQPSFSSSRSKDPDNSPQLLPQYGRRRPSFPDAAQTPPNRAHTYRPSNLHYSSSRGNDSAPHIDTPPETVNDRHSRADGTDSVDSTGAPASVWDELDELKSRIRRIELSGKMPATSGAAVSNGSGERPRTATTTVTTISSSPKHYRKPSTSPSESTIGGHAAGNLHPLLHAALAKAKEHLSTPIYRVLEATASDALELAALTGSAGPQGTLYSASSIINGVTVPDRQVRRKADSLCRSLTELCIAMCEVKTNSVASPSVRTAAAGPRRTSLQVNGESHTPTYTQQVRASIEPEGGSVPRSSPSRALSRIEARRSSIMGLNGTSRESSQEPPTPSQLQLPNRFSRAGTSLLRTRRTTNDEDDEDPTLRAPSRAMTDFSQIRSSTRSNRLSRDFNREPVPELQPSPALQHTSSLRRPPNPTAEATPLSSASLLRDGRKGYLERGTPEKSLAAEIATEREERRRVQPALGQYTGAARLPVGAVGGGLGKAGSLRGRVRGNGIGETF
ncbi:hypothetical protein K432DRAFT_378794 [Lepidopterella palustris CBS 459.81]|uniref:Uncharacterized protein n=1 Tax=Lepidopterella palustris CBS 459.81 TaxID=1314670 RepID=A0A8E2EI49_9PEZI|nr:hypothetical protein K432DRAFT_378794 [Lepidopterella palustris CBS 459.81]